MPFDTNAFIAEITKGANIDEAAKAALANVLSNPVVAKNAEDAALRQSDYSRLSSDLRTKIKDAQTYWDGLKTWQKDIETKHASEIALMQKRLADEGISVEDLKAIQPAVKSGVSQDEFRQFGQDALAYANAITLLGLKHLKEFGEVLDPSDVVKVSQENGGININLAYEKLIQPKRAELQQADIKKQLEQAREEGKAEALKNFQMPTNAQPFNLDRPHPTDGLNATKVDGAPAYGAMAASKAYMEWTRSGKALPNE